MNKQGQADCKILSRLHFMQNDMPKAMKRLAEHIIRNPNQIIASNISQIASIAGVGEATVVRFAKHLGYPGFQEFKIGLAIEISGMQKQDNDIVESQIKADDNPMAIGKKVLNAVSSALSENLDFLTDLDCSLVAKKIYQANKVVIIGMGSSGLCAQYLKNKLTRIGINALCEANTHFMYTAASLVSPGDVAIAISQKGASPETLKAFRIAKAAGALCVLITHQTGTVLAKEADYVFFSGNHEGFMQSDSLGTIVSQLHICEILYILLVQLNPQKAITIKQMTLKALGSKKDISYGKMDESLDNKEDL